MNKHTPGPWTWGKTRHTEKMPEWFIAANPTDVASVTVMHDMGRSMGEHESNARLIAAAPELLEALEACLPLVESECDALASVSGLGDADHDELHVQTCLLREKARAAIAKARGL